jgi:hypothetical protein
MGRLTLALSFMAAWNFEAVQSEQAGSFHASIVFRKF